MKKARSDDPASSCRSNKDVPRFFCAAHPFCGPHRPPSEFHFLGKQNHTVLVHVHMVSGNPVHSGKPNGLADGSRPFLAAFQRNLRSEEHTSELQSRENLVCRLLLEKKNTGTWRKVLEPLNCISSKNA